MYITDHALLAELRPLMGEGDEIDVAGITKLKQLYLASDTQPLLILHNDHISELNYEQTQENSGDLPAGNAFQ